MYIFRATVDGRRNRLKHVERLAEINEFFNVASCWLYLENIFVMHGTLNVKQKEKSGHLFTTIDFTAAEVPISAFKINKCRDRRMNTNIV
jgi:hypothetical protein